MSPFFKEKFFGSLVLVPGSATKRTAELFRQVSVLDYGLSVYGQLPACILGAETIINVIQP